MGEGRVVSRPYSVSLAGRGSDIRPYDVVERAYNGIYATISDDHAPVSTGY